jgi:hypothetical protein
VRRSEAKRLGSRVSLLILTERRKRFVLVYKMTRIFALCTCDTLDRDETGKRDYVTLPGGEVRAGLGLDHHSPRECTLIHYCPFRIYKGQLNTTMSGPGLHIIQPGYTLSQP